MSLQVNLVGEHATALWDKRDGRDMGWKDGIYIHLVLNVRYFGTFSYSNSEQT